MGADAYEYYQKALIAEKNQKIDDAILYTQSALNLASNDALLHTKLAGLYQQKGDWEKALREYKSALSSNPNDAFVYISIGNILQQHSDYNGALNAYNQAMRLSEDYKYNYLNIATVKRLQGKYDEAVDYYRKFLMYYPSHTEARESLAIIYSHQNKPLLAKEQYEYIYNTAPSSFKSYSGYGKTLLDTNNVDRAIEILKTAIESNPNDAQTHGSLAMAYARKQDVVNAEKEFQTALTLAPDADSIRYNYASFLVTQNKWDKAKENYNICLANNPKNINLLYDLGMVYQKQNDHAKAIENFEKALEYNQYLPDDDPRKLEVEILFGTDPLEKSEILRNKGNLMFEEWRQNMIDKDYSTSYKSTAANSSFTYYVSQPVDLRTVRIVQSGTISNAKVIAHVYSEGTVKEII